MKHLMRQSLQIATHPGKLVSHPLKRLYERHYQNKKFARTLFLIDFVVLLAIAVSTALVVYFALFRPPKIIDQVQVDATVAPADVVSGGLSTLVIRYENTSGEALRFTRMHLEYPAHFDLKEVQTEFQEVAPQTYDLGTVEPGASGSIKLHGVMFGDVGGEQKFKSDLTFTYGPNDRSVTKSSEHTFSPSHSTLSLELVLPDQLVQGQEVNGQINYKNTGDVDFPEIAIEPEWPSGFVLRSSTPTLTNGLFALKALKAHEQGSMEFSGAMPNQEAVDFVFHPSFTFGDDRYTQDVLRQTIKLLPPQLTVTTTFDSTSLTPGGKANLTIHYEHTGEVPLKNVIIRVTSTGAIVKTPFVKVGTFAELNPSDTGTLTASIPLAATVNANGLSSFTNLSATFQTSVDYALESVPGVVSFVTNATSLPITSPVILESFGRYTSPQGDQIGRGPLPPLVGEETKYWVFLTIRGTTNQLEGVKMEATLGPGVSFTGKQSVSYNGSVDYNAATGVVSWAVGSLPPTLASASPVVSAAFEVALTPTAEMAGSTPTLVASPLLTGRDTFTGAFVTARGAAITTNLPYDQMAAGLGVVEL